MAVSIADRSSGVESFTTALIYPGSAMIFLTLKHTRFLRKTPTLSR
jgi:hypothetical protein